jgi:putative DNA primase/helicase
VSEIPRELLKENRNQLWAEAVACVERGEHWWLTQEYDHLREVANFDFEDEDPWRDTVCEWVSKPNVLQVTITDILRGALELDAARQDRWAQMRVARILGSLGWRRGREATGSRRWHYTRPA